MLASSVWTVLAVMLVASNAAPHPALPGLGTTAANQTVSGISSGGYMAVQVHVAFSSDYMGAGVLAAGPFFCAQDLVEVALSACTKQPELILVPELVQITKNTALAGTIDLTKHLADARVWLFSGTLDTEVVPGVVEKLRAYYSAFVSDPVRQIAFVNDIPAEHSFVTSFYGSDCAVLGSPYINNCGLDSAGALLQYLFDHTLTVPSSLDNVTGGELMTFDQLAFLPAGVTGDEAGLNDYGYVFVPDRCQKAELSCRLHLAFHGCLQTVADVGDAFVAHTGYNAWAVANDIVMLYPQTKATALNPKGCWDWWGYTGTDYASKAGFQMIATSRMTKQLQTANLFHRS